MACTSVALETTTFYVEVTDSTGCIGSDNVTVFVSEEDPFFNRLIDQLRCAYLS